MNMCVYMPMGTLYIHTYAHIWFILSLLETSWALLMRNGQGTDGMDRTETVKY